MVRPESEPERQLVRHALELGTGDIHWRHSLVNGDMQLVRHTLEAYTGAGHRARHYMLLSPTPFRDLPPVPHSSTVTAALHGSASQQHSHGSVSQSTHSRQSHSRQSHSSIHTAAFTDCRKNHCH